jgi:replicative DNA helicase
VDTGDRVIDLQRSLLTSLVDSDGLNQVKRSGIDQSFFEDSECKQVYAYIERHYAEYKKVPARVAVRQLFPNFGWAEVTEPLEFYIKQMKEAYRVVVLEEALLNINTIYNKDTQEAEAKIRDLLLNLAVTQKSFKDLNLVETSDERWDAYEARKANGVAGILSNWGKIDYETLGWHNGDFAVLVGQKYSGKSWLMLWLAHQAMKLKR